MSVIVEAKPLSSIKSLKVRRKLAHLCESFRDVHDEITALDVAKKSLMREISDIASGHKLQKIAGDGWLLTKSKGRKTLKKELLLAQGVTMDQIEKATMPGAGFYQVLERK